MKNKKKKTFVEGLIYVLLIIVCVAGTKLCCAAYRREWTVDAGYASG